jgi:hypothetical protein
MDPDLDPATFVIDLQDATKNYFFKSFPAYYFIKKSQNSRNQGFSYYFCVMIKGSGLATLFI